LALLAACLHLQRLNISLLLAVAAAAPQLIKVVVEVRAVIAQLQDSQ
jgi:hypothetical protein